MPHKIGATRSEEGVWHFLFSQGMQKALICAELGSEKNIRLKSRFTSPTVQPIDNGTTERALWKSCRSSVLGVMRVYLHIS